MFRVLGVRFLVLGFWVFGIRSLGFGGLKFDHTFETEHPNTQD